MQPELQQFCFTKAVPRLKEFWTIIDTNRNRLYPWFWWANKDIVPNKQKFIILTLCYIFVTKLKKLMNDFQEKSLYDEQFMIIVDDQFAGLIGLDNINSSDKDAELWYFVSDKYEGKGVATQSLKMTEDYSIKNKNLNSLYAKICQDNTRSTKMIRNNKYDAVKIEYNVAISKQNPIIKNIVTWQKYLNK